MKTAKKTAKRKPPAHRQVDEHGLNVRERKFADLMIPGNIPAGRAYEQAGYVARGSSADTQGCTTLKNPKVSAYIKGERRKAAEATQIERWELVGFLARVVKAKPQELDGDIAQVTREETDEGSRMIYKTPDKIAAAKQLCQMLGWNEPEKIAHTFSVVIGPSHNE